MTCSHKDMEPEIVIPIAQPEKWEKLLDSIASNSFDGLCSISDLADYQKQPKNWPDHKNIPEYCLYLGSFTDEHNGPVDLYHYRCWQNPDHYSTGIVFGNEDHEYMSGWIGIRFSACGAYEELWMREYECGLLSDEWITEEARIGLATIARQRQMARIKELREKRNQSNVTEKPGLQLMGQVNCVQPESNRQDDWQSSFDRLLRKTTHPERIRLRIQRVLPSSERGDATQG